MVKFKSHILTLGAYDKRLDAYVPLMKLRKATIYKLKIIPENLLTEYTVFVRGERRADRFLNDLIQRFDAYFMEGFSSYPPHFRNNPLQSVTAELIAVTRPTHDDIKLPESAEKTELPNSPKSEVETFFTDEIQHAVGDTALNATIASRADVVTPIGTQRAVSGTNLLQTGTKIEMGLQSQVLVAPGMTGQLQFEITNTRTEAIYHNIQVVDERRFLLRLTPQNVFLPAGQTAIVTVTVLVPNGTPQGTVDRITFTCHGGGTASLSLQLKVVTTVDAQDYTSPSMSWEFGNRCGSILAESSYCAERFWTLDVTAQDWETGILRLQTTPGSGLYYRNAYTVGSTEPIKATYIASCCEPKVALMAIDIAGNQRSYNVDVRDLVLSEASIAAIVLGSLLLLILIILIIIGIVWCCRRRKVTLDLPTYRSHSTRSME